jgi:cytochrome c oxidase subunit 2
VPEFLFKLDVIPGNANGRNNVFEVTVRKPGAYVGRCAELCGEYHAFMNFEVRAVSPQDYDAYLKARQSGQDTRSALQSIGQPGTAVTTHPFNLDQHYQQAPHSNGLSSQNPGNG